MENNNFLIKSLYKIALKLERNQEFLDTYLKEKEFQM